MYSYVCICPLFFVIDDKFAKQKVMAFWTYINPAFCQTICNKIFLGLVYVSYWQEIEKQECWKIYFTSFY